MEHDRFGKSEFSTPGSGPGAAFSGSCANAATARGKSCGVGADKLVEAVEVIAIEGGGQRRFDLAEQAEAAEYQS